jgi:hypothetical protein
MGLKEVSLTFGVAVLFALLVGFTIDAFYESPQYDKFCNPYYYNTPPQLKVQPTNCTPIYSTEFEMNCTREKGEVRYKYDETGCQIIEGCDFCSLSFQDAEKKYNLNLLWITAILGVIAILVGMYAPIYADPIASGFIFGGIFILIYGTARSFSNLSKIARVIILIVEFAILIWLGIRKVLKIPGKKAKQEKKPLKRKK